FPIPEMCAILAAFKKQREFYFPLVLWQFETGIRPSETAALKWRQLKTQVIQVRRSRNLGKEGKTTTKASFRHGYFSATFRAFIRATRMPHQVDQDYVFENRLGGPVSFNEFRKSFWVPLIKSLPNVEYRKPRAMRQTAITESVRSGANLMGIAQHYG